MVRFGVQSTLVDALTTLDTEIVLPGDGNSDVSFGITVRTVDCLRSRILGHRFPTRIQSGCSGYNAIIKTELLNSYLFVNYYIEWI